MKTTLLLSTIFLSLTIVAQNFAPLGAKWHYEIRYAFAGDIDYTVFEAVNQTTINGQTCTAISKSVLIQCLNRQNTEFVYDKNDSVYYYDMIADQFYLLYDFTAGKGDHWDIYSSRNGPGFDTIGVDVDSVSTTQINSQTLKTLHVTYSYPHGKNSSRIIEKIGDVGFMFNWGVSDMICDIDYVSGLRCYEDSSLYFNTGIAKACNYTFEWTGINSLTQTPILNIYPNPTNDEITINAENLGRGKIQVSNHFGQVVYEDSYWENLKIDVSDWAPGMYFINFSDNGLSIVKRFIKQ